MIMQFMPKYAALHISIVLLQSIDSLRVHVTGMLVCHILLSVSHTAPCLPSP